MQLVFHHFKKRHIFELLRIIALPLQLFDLSLVKLCLNHEKALIVLKMKIVVNFKDGFDVQILSDMRAAKMGELFSI